jgi:hypothetical protein
VSTEPARSARFSAAALGLGAPRDALAAVAEIGGDPAVFAASLLTAQSISGAEGIVARFNARTGERITAAEAAVRHLDANMTGLVAACGAGSPGGTVDESRTFVAALFAAAGTGGAADASVAEFVRHFDLPMPAFAQAIVDAHVAKFGV